MKLAYGAKVFSADGKQLGLLHEVVIEPRSRMVTHLVIQSGLFFSADTLLPADLVSGADKGVVHLSIAADAVKQEFAVDFKRSEYVLVEGSEYVGIPGLRTNVWARPQQVDAQTVPYPPIIPPGIAPLQPIPAMPVPLEDIALEKGSIVRTVTGREIGTVDECITDNNDKLTHLRIREGRIFSESKLIPIDWVTCLTDGEVILAVDLNAVDKLPAA